MKNVICKISVVYAFILTLFFIPGETEQVYDIISLAKVTDFFVQDNLWHTLLAPFVDIPHYFVKFTNFRMQTLSWFVWIYVIFIVYILFFKRKIAWVSLLKPLILFFVLVSYVLLFPYPAKPLVAKNKNNVLIDFHSHTYYSWDGIASINKSIKYHKNNGFDAYAITEHDLMITDFVKQDVFKNMPVIFGTEFYVENGTHFNVYNVPSIDSQHNPLAAVLWWEHETAQDVVNRKVSTAEIENSGHTEFSVQEQQYAIKLFKKNNITMIGSTDWHGWSNVTYVWTAAYIPFWQKLNYGGKQQALIDTLKGKYKTQVLKYYRKGEVNSRIRFLFEPFVGMYYYFSSISFVKLVVWFFWIFVLFLFLKIIKRKALWSLLGSMLFCLGIYYLYIWIPVSFVNIALRDLCIYFFILSGLSFVVCRYGTTNK